jgi:hypothetical protein
MSDIPAPAMSNQSRQYCVNYQGVAAVDCLKYRCSHKSHNGMHVHVSNYLLPPPLCTRLSAFVLVVHQTCLHFIALRDTTLQQHSI